MAMSYWVAVSGQQYGPFPLADLRRMITEGRVALTDLAWAEGMPEWKPVSQVLPAEAPTYAPMATPAAPAPAAAPLVQQAPAPVYSAPATPTPAPVFSTPAPASPAPAAPMNASPAAPVPAASPMGAIPQGPPPGNPYDPAPGYAPPAYAQAPAGYGGAPAGYPQPPSPMGQPGFAPVGFPQQGYAQPMGGGPVPPALHWAIVLILGMVTFGLFQIVWVFVQTGFIKKIDPKNNSRMLFVVTILLEFLSVGLSMSAMMPGAGRAGGMIAALGLPVSLAAAVCALLAVFKMRSSMLQYYNTVEPIQLKLSGVMTFFFNIFYFQYHFTRIAEWKKTGRLVPQK